MTGDLFTLQLFFLRLICIEKFKNLRKINFIEMLKFLTGSFSLKHSETSLNWTMTFKDGRCIGLEMCKGIPFDFCEFYFCNVNLKQNFLDFFVFFLFCTHNKATNKIAGIILW